MLETYNNAEDRQKGFGNGFKCKNENQDKRGPLLET